MQYVQPQVASTGDRIGMVFGSGNDILYTHSDNDGETFTRPVRIRTGGKLSLGRHRGPRLVYQSGYIGISAVVGQKGGGADGDLLMWRSDDNGRTWKDPVRVNSVEGSAREGLHAMASGNGWVVAVWLDLRAKGTRLYGALSTDGGDTWGKNFLVYESPSGTICQCCHPSVTIGPGGVIYVMFRNALDGSRDMYVLTSRDRGETWTPAYKMGKQTWKLEACPMDGGGFAISSDNRLYTTWRREKTVFVARPDSQETEMGAGKDPSIATGVNQSVYVVWSDTDGIKYRSTLRDSIQTLSPVGTHPQVIFTGRRVLAFWEQEGGIAMGIVEQPAPLLSGPSR